MKKSFLLILSLVVLLSSVLTVVASAETNSSTDDMYFDDMYDDDENVTFDNGTTATTKGGFLGSLGNLGGDGVGDFVGGVVESVFQDNDVSEQVGNKVNGVAGIFDNFDLGGLIPTTQKQTTGSNFFDPITPAVTGGSFSSGLQSNNTTASNPIPSLNGESVDYNTTVNPYAKPTSALNPGDKGDGVKWLQWVLIYTECGLQGVITGDYDDATAAAVKTLQLKYGLTVDGIASLEVIEKADQMYNEYISGISQQTTGSGAVFNTVGSTSGTTQGNKNNPDTNVAVTIIIVVLVIVWIFAIAVVIIIIHIKRSGVKLSEDGQIERPEKEQKAKKEKKQKSKKSSKRSSGTLKDYEPLRESKTLQSLEDDIEEVFEDVDTTSEELDFEVVDIIDDDFDDYGEIVLSSLSEVKKKRAEKNSAQNDN